MFITTTVENAGSPARGRGEPAGLTTDQVVDAAVDLLESDGLESFSLRGVARSLGVTPAALYQHVGSRERLLSLVVDRYVDGLKLPASDAGWREFTHQL